MQKNKEEFTVDCYGNVYIDMVDDNGERVRGVVKADRARSLRMSAHGPPRGFVTDACRSA